MARKAFSVPYPRFILLDKTRIWLGMARKAFSMPYPRFILLDKTRIWLGKHVSQEFMISVRPSATHPSVRPSVRHSSVRPYPRFILTLSHRCLTGLTCSSSSSLSTFGWPRMSKRSLYFSNSVGISALAGNFPWQTLSNFLVLTNWGHSVQILRKYF